MVEKVKSKRLPEPEDDNFDVKELLAIVKSLQKEVSDLKAEKETNIDNSEKNIEEVFKINSDEYIKVMSLMPYTLNLTTEPKGKGKIFQFRKYGEVKNIIYSQLASVIETHMNFLESGYFVILNDRVIRRHGLNDAYERILTKENIDKVLAGNQSDAVKLFENANINQQEVIVMMFVNKIINDEKVDLNFLDRISRIIGYDIAEKAELTKETMKIAKKANEGKQ